MDQNRDRTREKGGVDRREFIRTTARLGAGLLAGQMMMVGGTAARGETTGTAAQGGASASPGGIPLRDFGKTGVKVSALGLGGSHIGKQKDEAESIRLIHEAIDNGITFMDNAWEYHDGRSEERMGKALEGGRREKVFLMTKVCTHGRDAKVAMQQLEDSLRRLKTDYLDLWQIHEIAYDSDAERHFAANGTAEALLKAKEQGKVRFLGFTGHKHPDLHMEMLQRDFPWDAVQMPLNAFDASYMSFEKNILPVLQKRGIAPIGMKTFGGTAAMIKDGVIKPEEALRYAMSLPVAVTVTGIDSMEILQQDLKIARNFQPMSPEEMDALRKRMAPYADGRYELFKTTSRFEGRQGREQQKATQQTTAPQ